MLSLIGGMLVSTPIQHFFLAMTHYPSWQALGQAEVDAVCGERMPTVDDMPNLPVVRVSASRDIAWFVCGMLETGFHFPPFPIASSFHSP
jgi:hypothetical protein